MTSVTFCSYDKPGNVGGPFSWLRRLLPALRDRGIDCRGLILTHYGGTGPIIEGLRDDGFECSVINCHDRTVDQVRWILERVQENPPDVFVPNLVVSAYHAASWVRTAGIPTVGVLHSDDPYYRAIQDEFIFGARVQQLTSVVCVSRELEQQVIQRQPANTKIIRIPYGVPIPANSVTPTPSRFRIAYVGRLAEKQKRISDTVQALIRACRSIPGADAVIYGDGPDRNNVEAILAANPDAAVNLVGNIANDRIQQKLVNCDAIVLLSDYEGLPIALLEAMACGCVPVCLQMRSGIPELIQDDVNGIVATDRGQAFVTAMQRLAHDIEMRQRLATNARATIVDHFSAERSADQWAHQLKTLASQTTSAKFVAPRRIVLPRRNAVLESAEQRQQPESKLSAALRKGRMWAGRIRRRIL